MTSQIGIGVLVLLATAQCAQAGPYTLTLAGGRGELGHEGTILIKGELERDGSAGITYHLVGDEGYVCGDFYLSRWDPDNEGSTLTNAIEVTWTAPEGSVARTCAEDYTAAEGRYSGDSSTFQGTFTKPDTP